MPRSVQKDEKQNNLLIRAVKLWRFKMATLKLSDLYGNYGAGVDDIDVSEEQYSKIMEAVNEFNRNEHKYEMRQKRHLELFGYRDGCKPHFQDAFTDTVFDEVDERFCQAGFEKEICGLSVTQQRRIRMRIYGYTVREISSVENVNINAVQKSLESARRKIEKLK
jgi:hypothetical protein